MTDEVDDGSGRYASRVRVNRRVLDISADGSGSISGTIDMNGKISRIILDMTDMDCTASTNSQGSMAISMDGATEYPYCNTVSSLDFRNATNLVGHFQIAEGANTDTAGVHLTVTSPGNVVGSWNGCVVGRVKFTLSLSASKVFTASAGSKARIVILHE